jgi:hypothetical protein
MKGISSIPIIASNVFKLITKKQLPERDACFLNTSQIFNKFSGFMPFSESINCFYCSHELLGRLTHSNSKQIFYEFSLGAFKIAFAIMVAVFVDIEHFLIMCHETWQPISIFSPIDVQFGYPNGFVRLQHCDPPSKIIPPWVPFESNETQWVGILQRQ